jgi:hypothetical protein
MVGSQRELVVDDLQTRLRAQDDSHENVPFFRVLTSSSLPLPDGLARFCQ